MNKYYDDGFFRISIDDDREDAFYCDLSGDYFDLSKQAAEHIIKKFKNLYQYGMEGQIEAYKLLDFITIRREKIRKENKKAEELKT
jgi:hypothetical protein